MNCEDFNFYDKVNMSTAAYLNNSCTNTSNTSQRVSDYFTGYDKIIANIPNVSGICGVICQYDDTNGSNYVRSQLQCGTTNLDKTKYYRISSASNNNFPSYAKLSICTQKPKTQIIKENLNSIDDDALYGYLLTMTPFLIFLVIFSFSYLVLRRVVKSSSNGGVSI